MKSLKMAITSLLLVCGTTQVATAAPALLVGGAIAYATTATIVQKLNSMDEKETADLCSKVSQEEAQFLMQNREMLNSAQGLDQQTSASLIQIASRVTGINDISEEASIVLAKKCLGN